MLMLYHIFMVKFQKTQVLAFDCELHRLLDFFTCVFFLSNKNTFQTNKERNAAFGGFLNLKELK